MGWQAGLAALALAPMMASGLDAPDDTTDGGTCGYGPVYAGEAVTFSHAVQFTVAVREGSGYLVDCTVGADAYLELDAYEEGVWYRYFVWGQLGDYQ